MSFSYDKVKQELLEERGKLREQLEHMETAQYESIGYSNHMADDATDAFDQAVDVALKREVALSLEEIGEALTKLDKGTYGLCEVCGGRIDRARLEALPQASRCMDCQARREYNGARAASH